MKLNLDSEPSDMGQALNIAFRVISENPQQEIGTGGAVYVRSVNGVLFQVVRNEDSYTARAVSEGGTR